MWRKVGRVVADNRQIGGRQARTAVRQVFNAALLALAVGFCPGLVQARGPGTDSGLPMVATSQLPVQGQDVLVLIRRGGPFRYDKDGAVFGNRERILPTERRGYYREYTVRTPRERSRGARRIVCGGLQPVAPDACYYTDDHYASFRRIVE